MYKLLNSVVSCHAYLFSGGVDINVDKNENVEAPETGKVGVGVERMEEDQIGSIPIGNQIGTDMEGMEFRIDDQDVRKESLERGITSTVLVKTEEEEEERGRGGGG